MNSKNYRDIVLSYVSKLGEIDTLEDKLFNCTEGKEKIKEQINCLKSEVQELKRQIDTYKQRR